MNIYEPYVKVEESSNKGKFKPRKEQLDAINKAFKYFSKNKGKGAEFLWNAKMRFGKTVCALWLIEKLYKELGKKRVLIVTHRPVVNASWYGDFKHLFEDELDNYSYGTAKEVEGDSFKDFYKIKDDADNKNKCSIFFASMQYLRLAKIIRGEGNDDSQVKQDILNYNWDLVIVDEAHEGTQTDLGEGVIDYLHNDNTFMLYLSGTPFNLLEKFKGDQIYNWDYIKEQETKKKWDEDHKNDNGGLFGKDVNPYRELPQMSIMTFKVGEMTDEKSIIDAATNKFSFTEFFRVKTGHDVPMEERGKFVHENEILQFLQTMWKPGTGYPFSCDEYRKFFRHTLWVVPGVKEAKALKTLIETKTPMKKWGFKVVNVAGNSEDDEQKSNALDKVFEAMKVDNEKGTDDSDLTHTITLSCGRLTTGVTVRPWTAVLYMKGSETTSASTYMQTIFRVQSPHTLHGMMKSKCYVFDFAPERSLIMMAETAKYSRAFEKKQSKEKKQKSVIDAEDKEKMKQLLEHCPLYETIGGNPIIVNGKMKPVDSERIFTKLTSVYVDKVVRNGFDHPSLYNYDEFLKLELEDEMNLNYVSTIFDDSTSDNNPTDTKIEVNHNEYTPEQLAAIHKEEQERKEAARKAREKTEKEEAEKLAKMTPEEREKYLKEKEDHARKLKLIHQSKEKLTGLSKRIPLMMYGANVEDFEEVTVENFTDRRFIDDASWNEFMPNGVTRRLFKKLTKFYNADVFRNAGIKIRQLAKEADSMKVEERIARIAQIFKWFKNPDKETVLTPWEVVNRHMSSTLGGYCFFDEDFKTPVVKVDKDTGEILETNTPRFVDRGDITKEVFGNGSLGNIDELQGKINTKILEINSKTGLYPLYVAYSLYRHLLPVYADKNGLMADNPEDYSAEDEQVIWDEVVGNNLYVICNTPMAERITRRTLLGFRKKSNGTEIRLHVKQDKLIERASDKPKELIADMLNEKFWENNKMKSKKIFFNAIVGNPPYQGSARVQLYPTFYKLAINLGNIATLIFPTGWQRACSPTAKGLYKLNNIETKEDNQIVFIDNCHNLFPGISGANEINIILWKKGFNNGYNGKQIIYTDGKDPEIKKLQWEQNIEEKPKEIKELYSIVKSHDNFISLKDYVSTKDPFKLPTDIFLKADKYNVEAPSETPNFETDIKVFGGINKQRAERYIPSNYPLLKQTELISRYKVFVPWAWGNMDNKAGLGGAYADIILALPNQVCTMTYNTCGIFESYEDVYKHAKYMLTKFFRALLFVNKDVKTSSQNAYSAIPLQDFKESWWDEDIDQLDERLFDKYSIPENIRSFIRDNIQTKSLSNILNKQ